MAEVTILPVVNSILGRLSSFDGESVKGSEADSKMIEQLLRSFCEVLQDADAILQDADAKQHGNERIKLWLNHIKSVVYDLDDLLDEFAYDALQEKLNKHNLFQQWWLVLSGSHSSFSSRKIKYFRLELEKLMKQMSEFQLETSTALKSNPTILETCENVSLELIGRDKEKMDIITTISSLWDVQGPSVLAVTGISGIGKTALAQQVYKDVDYLFDIKIWVSVPTKSRNSIESIPRILQAILKAATGETTRSICKEELSDKIKSVLNHKKYLLVLDDVCEESYRFWVEMKISLGDKGKGSILLITTRSEAVAFSVPSFEYYYLQCLPSSACWSIFKQLALSESEEKHYPMLSQIGQSLARKCNGIPLAAVLLGSLLRNEKDEGEWRRIDNMVVHDVEGTDDLAFYKLAYDKLPSHLKPCYTFLTFHQGDAHIVSQHQIFFWSALRLLKAHDEEVDIESCGQSYLMELLSRSILHDSEWTLRNTIASFKINDDLHHLARLKLGEDLTVISFADNILNRLEIPVLSRHVVWGSSVPDYLSDMDLLLMLSKARKVRTFRFGIHMGLISQRFVKGIISCMPYLYILDVGHSYFDELPSSIGDLKHLRVLNISFNPIIKYLPDAISKLLNLQAFYLEGCVRLQELSKKVYRLVSLRCFTVTTCQRHLIGTKFNKLSALQELQFLSCKGLVSLWEGDNIGRLISLRRLQFHDCPELVSLPNSMRLLVNLKELVIADCQFLDLGEGEALTGLVSLQSLEISGSPLLTCLPDGIQSAARSLQCLLLRSCTELVELPNWLELFLVLQSLIIYNCPNLLTLPKGFYHNKSVVELKIKGCSRLSHWCESESTGLFLIEHIPKIEIDGHGLPIEGPRSFKHGGEASTSSQTSEFGAHSSQTSEFGAHEISQPFRAATKRHTKWRILALDLKAICKLRLLLKEVYKRRDSMKHYCSLFPVDYGFERETLAELWMASGYLTNERMEESAKRYFDILLDEEHILPLQHNPSASKATPYDEVGNDNFVGKRRYILNIEKVVDAFDKDFYTILKDENMGEEVTKYQHISVVSSYINQTTFETLKKCKELRTLLFIRNYGPALTQIPSDLFLTLDCLESLDLSGSHLKVLPGSIGNVTQLHYLDLSFTLIERLPESIDRLLKLQTLKLKGCKRIYTLPKGMNKLINLRHLYFDVLGQLSFMPRGIGTLTKLRTLSAFIVDDKDGCNIDELANMINLTGSCCISGLENIQHFNVEKSFLLDKRHLQEVQLRWDEYGAANKDGFLHPVWYLEPHSCLEKLEVFYYPSSRLPHWICKEKFQNLTNIKFLKCENTKLDIRMGLLPNLKCLHIIEMNQVETIDRLVDNDKYASFPKLEKLVIDGMHSLASWTDVASQDFPLLSELSLKHCPRIKSFPFLAILHSLENLEISHCSALESLSSRKLSVKLKTLVIDRCHLLKKKCSMNGEDWDKIEHVPEIRVDLENIHSPSEDSHHSSDSEEGELGSEESEASEDTSP